MKDFDAYSVGICCASVCTSLSIEEATARLNVEHPTGVMPWALSEDRTFRDGTSTNPCPCHDAPQTHKHYLFNC